MAARLLYARVRTESAMGGTSYKSWESFISMRFTSIASGSSGNCIYVGSDNTHILIDAGVSKKKIEEGLNGLDLSLGDIDAIFVTHEHVDHIAALHTILKKYQIPIYATNGTIKGNIKNNVVRVITLYQYEKK